MELPYNKATRPLLDTQMNKNPRARNGLLLELLTSKIL